MPDVALFLIGLLITCAVCAAFALLIRAEIGDGAIAEADAAGRNHELDETVEDARGAPTGIPTPVAAAPEH